ncbi:MAG TPA: Dabb family protein [Amnibacterium sp.]|jgi:hypothetical protein|nr:Dabb family protein [Amnibacterium sp.]
MIEHTVCFTLVHAEGSDEERGFLERATTTLTSIPVVTGFTIRRQVSPKSDYRFQFRMMFADSAAYDAYNRDPAHVRFVEEHWTTEVRSFEELDFVPWD